MYNAEIKQKFIDETLTKRSQIRTALTIFKAIEPYEIQWGADVCTQSLEVVNKAINGMLGLRAGSGLAHITVLKQYVQWCHDHNIPGVCMELLNLKRTGVEGVFEYTLKDPSDLQAYLDKICDAEKFQTYDCALRVWLWLAYMGFQEDESVRITTDDVNLKSFTVTYRGENQKFARSGEIYPQAVAAFRQCLKSSFYHPIKDSVVERERVSGKYLVRGTRAEGIPKLTTLRIALLKRNNSAIDSGSTEKRMCYFRIWISGLFYRQYLNEKATGQVNFYDVADEQAAKACKADADTKAYEYKRNQLIRNYEIDYQRWKIVYGLDEESSD